jgi:hypothetical protein
MESPLKTTARDGATLPSNAFPKELEKRLSDAKSRWLG